MTTTTTPIRPHDDVRAWESDPGEPGAPYAPIVRPRPALGDRPLPLRIAGGPPAADDGDVAGTPAFRYWAAAEALRRASDLWGAAIGPDAAWHPSVGALLPVALDAGVDLNAYYDRGGLHFFHAAVAGHDCHAGESPDVACHEHGHAVLDGLRPQLFDAPFAEVAAFHEAFGDVSAILAALQLASVRDALLAATGGRIHRSSSVSRLAEQLGWAIRQRAPAAVDRDALRNVATTWFYRDPAGLPPSAPASQLSSEPHSFSRVFSGAFLHALSGMLLGGGAGARVDGDALLAVAADGALLLRAAVAATPVVPAYLSQLAAHLLVADAGAFGGRHRAALTGAFVRHGILSVGSVAALTARDGAALAAAAAGPGLAPTIRRVVLPAAAFGLPADLIVETPAQPRRFDVAGATPDLGAVPHRTPERAAASFVQDLLRCGRIDLSAAGEGRAALASPVAASATSHELLVADDGFVLRRRRFDCGLWAG